MRWLGVAAFVALTGCQNPTLGVSTSIGAGGVSVSPTLSGNVGGVGVAVSP